MTGKKPQEQKRAASAARPHQYTARLSEEEKADVDAAIERWKKDAAAHGFAVDGFADWVRFIARREKTAKK